MLMRLDRKMVNIMDHENKEVVERFPIHLVREPTAFTSSDPKVRRGNSLKVEIISTIFCIYTVDRHQHCSIGRPSHE